MPYALTYNGLAGQSGYYARVQRKTDGKWWDEISSAWITTATANCDLAFTEGSAGTYTDSAGLTPAQGAVYIVYVYTSAAVLLAITEDVYNAPYDKTTIQMVNDVQRELRLPQSTLITDAHAALILGFLNKVMRNFLPEAYVWDELKVKGSFATVADIAVYQISPVNTGDIDLLRNLQIGTDDPLIHYPDDEFRANKRVDTSTAQPKGYRIYGRAGGFILVELTATPDAAYQIDYEGLEKPARLSAAIDIPMLDPDTLILGAIMLARQEQGVSSEAELAAFQAKLGLQGDTQGESNWGDVEPV